MVNHGGSVSSPWAKVSCRRQCAVLLAGATFTLMACEVRWCGGRTCLPQRECKRKAAAACTCSRLIATGTVLPGSRGPRRGPRTRRAGAAVAANQERGATQFRSFLPQGGVWRAQTLTRAPGRLLVQERPPRAIVLQKRERAEKCVSPSFFEQQTCSVRKPY